MLLEYFLLGFIIQAFANAESVEEEQGDQYYGVPLGALHYSADGTSAEVYAADEFTIVFNHFYHNPREPGCTAMMIGPPRPEDKENLIEGHGILLPVGQTRKHKRTRRYAGRRRDHSARLQVQQFQDWPEEFDHLLLEPPSEVKNKQTASTVSKSTTQKSTTQSANTTTVNNSTESTTPKQEKIEKSTNTSKKMPSSTTSSSTNSTPSTSTATTTTTTISPVDPPTTSKTTPKAVEPEKRKSQMQPMILFDSKTINSKSNSHYSSAPIISVPSRQSSSNPVVLKSNDQQPAVGQTPSQGRAVEVLVTSSGETVPVATENRNLEMSRTALQQHVRDSATVEEIRRSPARQNFKSFDKSSDGISNDLDPSTSLVNEHHKDQLSAYVASPPSQRPQYPPATAPRSTTPPTTTPRFWVIKDPREARRQRLLALRRNLEPFDEVPTTTTTQAPIVPFQPQFDLPRTRDRLLSFTLTNGAKITQYKWIGLYNQCTRRNIPLVSLRDIDPPREEKIMPLSGWSHNVTSYRLHILNCNTILIPSFHYDGKNSTNNTHFFIGIGQFPDEIESQVKANVVGTKPGQPLRNYSGEDVLLRLPRTYRTFDVDFISVFNTDENQSFGHVLIPSLLVPPCTDD